MKGEEVIRIGPQPGPQEALLSTSADICIYGGAAGGGKSYALLLEPIRHINNPGFGAVVFRKNANQIMAEGGLWDTSMAIYPLIGGISKQTPTATWNFPSGAKVSFSHMQLEKDVLSWQGSQIPLIAFDELTHFSQSQFFYMLSRNRSVCGVRPYVRATTNPDVDSWVADFISWWIDQDTGYAILERSGKIRYMARLAGEIIWGDSPEELVNDEIDLEDVKTVTFIASKLSDNQILMKADPGYMSNLKALSLVERERLLEGNWKIRPAAGLIFPSGKANLIDVLPSDVIRWIRAWDMAATEDKAESKKNNTGPAHTAGVLIGKTRSGRFIIGDVIDRAMSASDVRNTVKNTAILDRDKYKRVRTRISQDPGQAGKDQAEQYIKLLSGFDVVAKRESGDKVTRAEGLAAQWQAGNVDILMADWTEAYLKQMDNFPEGKLKDMVDASANGFNEIGESQVSMLPDLSDLSKESYWRG
ncbi:phage terminase large subunit [Acetobacterium tundrae]|uniref:Phage terminase large subunit n=1 Tax=Acetobacterium tundrae TaxID=132932 RepID=A0ABR6WP00_9FIRM|nr:phage terminase large subunit [Acetobacterium tundrae]MBC3798041.1 phage terminase large subunit [Acetobacterium tundrae]